MIDVDKKFNKRTLFRIRQFYEMFSNEKVSIMSTQLTWSHYTELLSIKDGVKRKYYINRCINQPISIKQLRRIKKEKEYERLPESTKEKLKHNKEITLIETVKDPILIKSKDKNNDIKEYELKQLILENLDSFLKQLGEGYSYISNEYKEKINDTYNYIDILLYNYIHNCFTVVELKVTKLKKNIYHKQNSI